MKFFVDTADIKEIEELIPTGFVDGVTTNPSLIAKNGDDMAKTIKAICALLCQDP
jgi:transaldolase